MLAGYTLDLTLGSGRPVPGNAITGPHMEEGSSQNHVGGVATRKAHLSAWLSTLESHDDEAEEIPPLSVRSSPAEILVMIRI